MIELESFRSETRAWLEANCPPEMREPMRSEEDACWGGRNWTLPVATRSGSGWSAWPSAAGPCPTGRRNMAAAGSRRPKTKVLKEEMARIGARPPLTSFGISMLGPALLKFGTEEQKKHLPARDRARRDPLVPGLFRAGRRLRPRRAADQGRGQGRPLAGQRPEGLDQLCRQGRLDLLPRPHLHRVQAGRDQLPAVRHGDARRVDQADPADQRQFAVLRDLLRRREGAQGPGRRRGEQRLGRRQISARPRARDDRRHGPWRTGGSRRSARRCGQARRSVAARRDRRVRRRRARLRGDERALHRRVEGRRSAPRQPVDDEICRHRAQQAPPRAGDGRRRLATRSNGTASGRSSGKAPRDWLRTKANSIEGGTSEIQLNIVAKHILGLPGA